MKFVDFLKTNNLEQKFNTDYKWEAYIDLPDTIKDKYFNSIEEVLNAEIDDVRLINGILTSKDLLDGLSFDSYMTRLKNEVKRGKKPTEGEKRLLILTGKLTSDYFNSQNENDDIMDSLKKDNSLMSFEMSSGSTRSSGKITLNSIMEFILSGFKREHFINEVSINELLIYLPTMYCFVLQMIKDVNDFLNTMINPSVVLSVLSSSVLSSIIYTKIFERVKEIRDKNKDKCKPVNFIEDQTKHRILELTVSSKPQSLSTDDIEYLKKWFNSVNGITEYISYQELSDEDKKVIDRAFEIFKLFKYKTDEQLVKNKISLSYNLMAVFMLCYCNLGRGFDRKSNVSLPESFNNALISELKGKSEETLSKFMFEDDLTNMRMPSLLFFPADLIPSRTRNRCFRVSVGSRCLRSFDLIQKDSIDQTILEEDRIKLHPECLHHDDLVFLKFALIMLRKGSIIYNLEMHNHHPNHSEEMCFGYSKKLATLFAVMLTGNKPADFESKLNTFANKHKEAHIDKIAQFTRLKSVISDHYKNPNNELEDFDNQKPVFSRKQITYWMSRYLYQLNWSDKYYHAFPVKNVVDFYNLVGLKTGDNFINYNNMFWSELKKTNLNKDKLEQFVDLNNQCHGYKENYTITDEDFNKLSELIDNIDLSQITLDPIIKFNMDEIVVYLDNNMDKIINEEITCDLTPFITSNSRSGNNLNNINNQASSSEHNTDNVTERTNTKNEENEKNVKKEKSEESINEGKSRMDNTGDNIQSNTNDNQKKEETDNSEDRRRHSSSSTDTKNSSNSSTPGQYRRVEKELKNMGKNHKVMRDNNDIIDEEIDSLLMKNTDTFNIDEENNDIDDDLFSVDEK